MPIDLRPVVKRRSSPSEPGDPGRLTPRLQDTGRMRSKTYVERRDFTGTASSPCGRCERRVLALERDLGLRHRVIVCGPPSTDSRPSSNSVGDLIAFGDEALFAAATTMRSRSDSGRRVSSPGRHPLRATDFRFTGLSHAAGARVEADRVTALDMETAAVAHCCGDRINVSALAGDQRHRGQPLARHRRGLVDQSASPKPGRRFDDLLTHPKHIPLLPLDPHAGQRPNHSLPHRPTKDHPSRPSAGQSDRGRRRPECGREDRRRTIGARARVPVRRLDVAPLGGKPSAFLVAYVSTYSCPDSSQIENMTSSII